MSILNLIDNLLSSIWIITSMLGRNNTLLILWLVLHVWIHVSLLINVDHIDLLVAWLVVDRLIIDGLVIDGLVINDCFWMIIDYFFND